MAQRTKFEFFQDASLSQKLGFKNKEFAEYAGADRNISTMIAFLNVLDKHHIINLKDPAWMLIKDLLDEERKAAFATSEKVNEITKMGLMLPRQEAEFFGTASK